MLNLVIKRVRQCPQCPRCNSQVEDSEHAGFRCGFNQEVWHKLGFYWPNQVNQMQFSEWLQWMFTKHTNYQHAEIITTIWAIWYGRNKKVHEGVTQSTVEVVIFIKKYFSELRMSTTSLTHHSVRENVRWIPPPATYTKVNVNASFLLSETKSITGIVIRDNEGEIIGAAYQINLNVVNVFEAEALAVTQGLVFAEEIGCLDIILEEDSKSIISKLKNRNDDLSSIRLQIGTAKSIAGRFRNCRFSFTGRQGNQTAHAMARSGRSASEDRFWLEEAPSSVLTAAAEDRHLLDPP
ncbi:hypothetical protein like AT3G09510 [Hibiscus trionum]|uniref:RNase H type-1 domain-containing protein n=1 Tax=Hibiscus trionum TaxID=183268 RepID=A0A9W7I1N3_HIBTR|nr:hypothetical protein like AT3G09510 [Hibiscus trionum]